MASADAPPVLLEARPCLTHALPPGILFRSPRQDLHDEGMKASMLGRGSPPQDREDGGIEVSDRHGTHRGTSG